MASANKHRSDKETRCTAADSTLRVLELRLYYAYLFIYFFLFRKKTNSITAAAASITNELQDAINIRILCIYLGTYTAVWFIYPSAS